MSKAGVTKVSSGSGFYVQIGPFESEDEAEMVADMNSEITRGQQKLEMTGLPGTIVMRLNVAPDKDPEFKVTLEAGVGRGRLRRRKTA